MALSQRLKEFFYSLSAADKYSDFDSRKSFNRINKPDVETSLLGASHNNDSAVSLSQHPTSEGVHETRLAWRHVKKWLHKYSEDINNSLSEACTEADVNELQKDLACKLPPCVVEFFRLTDGQSTFNDNGCCGLFYGLRLMPIDEIAVMTESWRQIHQSILQSKPVGAPDASADLASAAGFRRKESLRFPEQNAVPPNSILPIYAHSLWIPLISDGAGNFIGVDLTPGTDEAASLAAAKWGQVILYGRGYDTKFKIADSFGDFLLLFANDLERGNWDLRSSSDTEDMISGVDVDLVFVDHTTKKELSYLDVLKDRVIEGWLSGLSEEESSSEATTQLKKQLRERFSGYIPSVRNNVDNMINDNLDGIDALQEPDQSEVTPEAQAQRPKAEAQAKKSIPKTEAPETEAPKAEESEAPVATDIPEMSDS